MLRKNPKDPISLFYAAKVKYELGNYEECLTELKKLNDFHPNDPQINFQLGPIYTTTLKNPLYPVFCPTHVGLMNKSSQEKFITNLEIIIYHLVT